MFITFSRIVNWALQNMKFIRSFVMKYVSQKKKIRTENEGKMEKKGELFKSEEILKFSNELICGHQNGNKREKKSQNEKKLVSFLIL